MLSLLRRKWHVFVAVRGVPVLFRNQTNEEGCNIFYLTECKDWSLNFSVFKKLSLLIYFWVIKIILRVLARLREHASF